MVHHCKSPNHRPPVFKQVTKTSILIYCIYFLISTPRLVLNRQLPSSCSRTEAVCQSSSPRALFLCRCLRCSPRTAYRSVCSSPEESRRRRCSRPLHGYPHVSSSDDPSLCGGTYALQRCCASPHDRRQENGGTQPRHPICN